MKITVLCYHSWNMNVDDLDRDLRDLKSQGWTPVALKDLLGSVRGDFTVRGEKFFHVTNDDVWTSDEKFAKILERHEVPATFFVPTAMIPAERAAFYQKLDVGGLVSVEDHSWRHRKNFSGPKLVEFYSDKAKTKSIDYLGLQKGDPILELAGELQKPVYKIDPRVRDFCRAYAGDLSKLSGLLIEKGLAKRVGQDVHVAGTYETEAAFKERAFQEILEGKKNYKRLFVRDPRAFCYPFFHYSKALETMLIEAGYSLGFGGGNAVWDGKNAFVPRAIIENGTARPLALEKITHVSFNSLAARGLRAMGLGPIVDFVKKR